MQMLIKNVIKIVFLRLCKIRMPPKAVPVKKGTVLYRYETGFG